MGTHLSISKISNSQSFSSSSPMEERSSSPEPDFSAAATSSPVTPTPTVPPLIITLTGPAPKITKKHSLLNRSNECGNSTLLASASSTSFSSTGPSKVLGVPEVPDLGLVIRRQISGLVPNMHAVVDSDTEFLRGLNNELTSERERQNALMNVLAHYDKVEADKDNNNNAGDKSD